MKRLLSIFAVCIKRSSDVKVESVGGHVDTDIVFRSLEANVVGTAAGYFGDVVVALERNALVVVRCVATADTRLHRQYHCHNGED